jgi:antitoxin MazE
LKTARPPSLIADDKSRRSPSCRLVEALELKGGDEIEIHIADARRLAITRKPGRQELLKRLRAFRGRLPADFKFDRDDANAR